jgi:hypothetical protein
LNRIAAIIGTTAAQRREELLAWIAERPEHDLLTASQIADVSGIYDGNGKADRCFDDLKVLERNGHLLREGRPARWSLNVWRIG